MVVSITRRVEDLQKECDTAGVVWHSGWGREQYMDALRAKLGAFDLNTEIDPMKAADLNKVVDWAVPSPERYHGIQRYFTEDWVMEPKLDGCRLRLFMGLTGNSVVTGRRSVRTYAYTQRTENFPQFADAVVPELTGVILDGEVLAPQAKIQTHTGLWTNSLLNASVALCNSNPIGSRATQAKFGYASFWVFDILTGPGGEDVTGLPYTQRRALLESVIELMQAKGAADSIHLVPQYPAEAASIESAIDAGFEGVMIKKLTGVYEVGKRSKVWLKVKRFSSADAFVVGYSPGLHGNDGLVGSLDLAVMVTEEEALADKALGYVVNQAPDGSWQRPVAQVGNLIHSWRQEISAPDGSLKPEYYGTVIEFSAQALTKTGRARHASMSRIRADKTPQECLRDQLEIFTFA